jgi:glycosyltransferase involved in cell wall biosynthesis
MIPVLWVTQVYPRTSGDVMGAFLHRLARELPARGYAPVVVAPGADGVPEEDVRDGVRIVRFRYAAEGKQTLAYTGELHRRALRSPVRFARWLRSFRRAVRSAAEEVRPAVMHAHWWVPSGWVCAPVAAALGVPLALSVHGTDVRLIGSVPIARPLARRVFRRARLVLPVSRWLSRRIGDLAAGARTEILPMPADDGIFHPRTAGVGPGPQRFAAVARLTAQKRIDVAVRALARLRASGVEAVLEIAGDGPRRSALEELAGELGVRDAVTFHGFLPPNDVAELLDRSVALLVPSESEGYGLIVVEAALCGVPTLGVRSGALEELVEPGASGLLVEPGDAHALSEAMARLAGDAELRSAMGLQARERARASTPVLVADRLAALYAGLGPPVLDASGGPL